MTRCSENLAGNRARQCQRKAWDDLTMCSQHVRPWAQANLREFMSIRRGRVDAAGVHWIARETFELQVVFRVLRRSGPRLTLPPDMREPRPVHEIKGGVLLRVDVPTALVLADEAEDSGDTQTSEMLTAAAMLGQEMARDRASAMRAVLLRAGFDAMEVDRVLA